MWKYQVMETDSWLTYFYHSTHYLLYALHEQKLQKCIKIMFCLTLFRQDPVNAASFGKLIRSVFLGLRTRRYVYRDH